MCTALVCSNEQGPSRARTAHDQVSEVFKNGFKGIKAGGTVKPALALKSQSAR